MSADTFSIVLEDGCSWARGVPEARAIKAWRAARAQGVMAEIVRDRDRAQMAIERVERLVEIEAEEA